MGGCPRNLMRMIGNSLSDLDGSWRWSHRLGLGDDVFNLDNEVATERATVRAFFNQASRSCPCQLNGALVL